jgi:hypothetical protein
MLCLDNYTVDPTKKIPAKGILKTKDRNKKVVDFYIGSWVNIQLFREKIKSITVNELKEECKKYQLKRTGKKFELFDRLNDLYEKNNSCVLIQKTVRGFIARKYYFFRCKKLCTIVNETDFYSFEDISDIPDHQKYYVTCGKGYTYAFDALSLYKLYKQGKKKDRRKSEVYNPYTREKILPHEIHLFKKFIRLSKCLKYKVQLKDEDHSEREKELETVDTIRDNEIPERIRELFFKMDDYGFMTESEWFLELTREEVIQFTRELYDIWCYRLVIPQSVKNQIIYPNGRLIESLNLRSMSTMCIEEVQKIAYIMMKRLITKGVNESNRHLGVIYTLTGLTMVSSEAAHSLPFLYQSTLNT